MTTGWSLAIDFGTSNTAAAYLSGGQVTALRLESASNLMPSAVVLTDAGFRVGRAAVNQQRLFPERFEAAPKRRIGDGVILLGDTEVAVAQLVSEVFVHVRTKALTASNGAEPDAVWLTYPDAWTETQRAVLRGAAVAAGFAAERIHLVSEPVAAVQYYARTSDLGEDARLAVFDFGGGTCDVAVLVKAPATADGSAFTVVGSEGDNLLGGTDFDDRLFDWLLDQLRARGDGAVVDQLLSRDGLRARLGLRTAVREAKEELSQHSSSVIPVSVGEFETLVTITRGEYETVIADDLDRAIALARRVLERTGTAQGSLDRLYLTGGSSLTPAIIRGLQNLAGVVPATLDDPKLVVAQGALYSPGGTDAAPLEQQPPSSYAAETVTRARLVQMRAEARDAEATTIRPATIEAVPAFEPEPEPAAAAPMPALPPTLPPNFGQAAPVAAPRPPWYNRPGVVIGIIAAGILVTVVAALLVAGALSSLRPSTPSGAPGTETTTVDTVDCWDGSEGDEGDSCPALRGEEALVWVGVGPTAKPGLDCVAGSPESYSGAAGWSEMETCRWSDRPDTYVAVSRWASSDDALAAWKDAWNEFGSTVVSEALNDSAGNRVGTAYRENGPNYQSEIWIYDDIPFSIEIATIVYGTYDSSADDEHIAVTQSMGVRSRTQIADVLSSTE